MIDSHCHLDFPELYHNLDSVIARANLAGITAMVTISTRVHDFQRISSIAAKHNNVFCSVGTHCQHAELESEITTEMLVDLATQEPKCIAIGESGLDYTYPNHSKSAQITSFCRHVSASRATNLPLIVHARDADRDMIEILKQEMRIGEFPLLMHCFSSSEALLKTALSLGAYISFAGNITFKKADSIRNAAMTVPLDKVLVETDAPYLAPVPHRGKPNEPAYALHTAEFFANLRGLELTTFSNHVENNFYRLFRKAKGS